MMSSSIRCKVNSFFSNWTKISVRQTSLLCTPAVVRAQVGKSLYFCNPVCNLLQRFLLLWTDIEPAKKEVISMNKTKPVMQLSLSQPVAKVVLTDVVLLAAMCLVPAVSHLTALPLSMFDPMRLCLLAGMLLVSDRRNAYLLAVLLPVVCSATTGMPTFVVSLLIVAELLTNVALFGWLNRHMPTFAAMLLSVVGAKMLYYALKAVVLAPAVLVSTPLLVQLGVAVVLSALFALLNRKVVRG